MVRTPTIEPREIVAGVSLEPSGGHTLEIAVPNHVVGMRFTRDQVDQLEAAIRGYRAAVAADEGGYGRERTHRKFVPLEIG
ncbi:MAG TPA: hypothetical protein VD863_06995 [Bradyrhizobium sp.]|nr:hypothetical protein [Bradyrhizobium sp.]